MNNWLPTKLEDIADIQLSNVDKKTHPGERAVRLCNYTDVYKNPFIDEEKAKSFMVASCNENEFCKFILKEGQVAITKDSETPDDIGVSTYIAENFEDVILGYHLALITPNKQKLDGRFLHYWFNKKYTKRYFENNAGGSGQRCSLNLDILKSIPVLLPNLKTQKAISRILSNLDDKIELNNKINYELESLAKLIYDYWFVQFDFPNENGKPYKASGGKMIWNEDLKREIPEGWEVKKLINFVNVIKDIVSPKDIPSGTIYIGLEHIPRKSIILSRWETSDIVDSAKCKFNENDILFGKIRPYFHKVGICYFSGITSTDTIVLRPKSYDVHGIILQTVFNDDFVSAATRSSTGSKMPRADWNILKNYPVIYPPKLLREKFQSLSFEFHKKMRISVIQNKHLSELRDWLLPLLMNGQVRVVGE